MPPLLTPISVFLDSPFLGRIEPPQGQIWIAKVLGGLIKAGCHLSPGGGRYNLELLGWGLESLDRGCRAPEREWSGKDTEIQVDKSQARAKTIGNTWAIETGGLDNSHTQYCLFQMLCPVDMLGSYTHYHCLARRWVFKSICWINE